MVVLVCILTGLLQQSVDSTISTMTNVILKQNDTLASAIAPRGLPVVSYVPSSSSSSCSHTVPPSGGMGSDNAMDAADGIASKAKAVSNALSKLYRSFNMEAPCFDTPKAVIAAALDMLEDANLTEKCSKVPLQERLDLILTEGFRVKGV